MDPALKAIEKDIRTACEVDKALSPVFKHRYRCPLGQYVKPELDVLVDEQLNGDPPFHVTPELFEIWEKVCFEWMPLLSLEERKIVWDRCSGMGWKLVMTRYEKRTLTKTTRFSIMRLFKKGLKKIVN